MSELLAQALRKLEGGRAGRLSPGRLNPGRLSPGRLSPGGPTTGIPRYVQSMPRILTSLTWF